MDLRTDLPMDLNADLRPPSDPRRVNAQFRVIPHHAPNPLSLGRRATVSAALIPPPGLCMVLCTALPTALFIALCTVITLTLRMDLRTETSIGDPDALNILSTTDGMSILQAHAVAGTIQRATMTTTTTMTNPSVDPATVHGDRPVAGLHVMHMLALGVHVQRHLKATPSGPESGLRSLRRSNPLAQRSHGVKTGLVTLKLEKS